MADEGSLRFAIFGTGFWARYQLAGWNEVEGVECVALYNRTLSKAQKLGQEFGIEHVFDDAAKLLKEVRPDFVDIISSPDTHRGFVELAAKYRVPVICQKPFAPTIEDAEAMLRSCQAANIPFLIHENFRWQQPVLALADALKANAIGKLIRARIGLVSGFPVFKNQPFLRDEERFILMDVGTHVLDVARFLFGEASSLYCQAQRTLEDIKGENVASVMMKMEHCPTVLCEMGYAENYIEDDSFPQTTGFIEGAEGSIRLEANNRLRITTEKGTLVKECGPPYYPWADSRYEVVHASIVDCNKDMLRGIRGLGSRTTAEDNLKTLKLVDCAYASATQDQIINIS